MRIAWVHPSWRDLVIEHLAEDAGARRRFLRGCSINGALLALSFAGGATGDREAPLLRTDADWDVLTDRLHELVPELERAELIGLLDALGRMLDWVEPGAAQSEGQALAGAVLARVASIWNRSGAPIALSELESWLALASELERRPTLPVLTLTWAALLPSDAPTLLDLSALERFADWLALVDLLMTRDARRLSELGFPGQAMAICQAFLSEVASGRDAIDERAIAPVTRALTRIARVNGALAATALALARPLEPEPGSRETRLGPEPMDRDPGAALDVERVLRDL